MNKYIGKEYEAFARGPDRFDCWGICMDIYRDKFGIELHDHAYKSTHGFKDNALIYAEEAISSKWQPVEEAKEYDLVVFNIGGYPVHVGIMIDNKRFIHAHESCNVAIESIESVKWRSRVNGFYRHCDAIQL